MIEFIIGFCLGLWASFEYHRRHKVERVTIKMTAEEAMDLVESDDALKKLKKEMGW